MTPETIALLIFALTYLLFISDMVNRTVSALIGALLMVAYGIVSYQEVGSLINYKTLIIALGMMVTLNVVQKSGLFDYLSIKTVKLAKGNPRKLMIAFVILTAVVSTFFTNMITTLILGTLIVSISKIMKIDFLPFLIIIAITSNVAGALTPVSSSPNIIVASHANLSFLDFANNILFLIILLLFSTIIYFKFMFKKQLDKKIDEESQKKILELDEKDYIKNKKLFFRSLAILLLMIIFFLIQDITGIGNDVVAITGAILMLLLSSADPEEVFSEVQWSTLAFFIGLFIVVGSVEKVGALENFSNFILKNISERFSAVFLILAGTTLGSVLIPNVPITVLLLPILENINNALNIHTNLLYFVLVIGVNIGENLTPVGSPANIIALSIAKKNKREIKIWEFIKIGGFLTLIHFIITLVFFYLKLNFF